MSAFATYPTITWGLTVKVSVGDIIYIYVSAPYSRIEYKCIVERINVPTNERLASEFWLDKFDPNRNLIDLRLLSVLSDDKLQLKNLIDDNLISSAPQGPRRLDSRLETFLENL